MRRARRVGCGPSTSPDTCFANSGPRLPPLRHLRGHCAMALHNADSSSTRLVSPRPPQRPGHEATAGSRDSGIQPLAPAPAVPGPPPAIPFKYRTNSTRLTADVSRPAPAVAVLRVYSGAGSERLPTVRDPAAVARVGLWRGPRCRCCQRSEGLRCRPSHQDLALRVEKPDAPVRFRSAPLRESPAPGRLRRPRPALRVTPRTPRVPREATSLRIHRTTPP